MERWEGGKLEVVLMSGAAGTVVSNTALTPKLKDLVYVYIKYVGGVV